MSTPRIYTIGLRIARAFRDEQGQGLVEYALILLFVSIVAITVIQFLGPAVAQEFSNIANNL